MSERERQPLTPRQEQVYEMIVAFIVEHHQQPTLEEIAAGFGSKFRNAAYAHIRPLVRKGWLEKYERNGQVAYRLAGVRIEIVREYADEVWTTTEAAT